MPITTVALWQGAVDGLLGFIDQVGQKAVLQTRRILPPLAGSVDQRIIFDDFLIVEKMAFDSSSGVKTFDSIGIERNKDFDAFFEYTPNITTELTVLFQGNRYEILTVENIGAINGIIQLELQLMGSASKEASKS